MEFGVHQAIFDVDGGVAAIPTELAKVGQTCDEVGVTWFSFMDHFFQIEPTGLPADANMLDGYTALGYMAGKTSKVDLGLLVTGVTYRRPGLLAKIIATLDVLSEGRAVLGIGAAWFEREHLGLGVPFPAVAERFELLEETLQINRQMWDQSNDGPYQGKHFQLAETLCHPAPVRNVPILIGGGGEKKTLRLVAQYADRCNLFASSVEDVSHKLDVLRRHCADVDRDFDDIKVTVLAHDLTPGTIDEFVSSMEPYAKLGVHQAIVVPTGSSPATWIESVAPVVSKLADLG